MSFLGILSDVVLIVGGCIYLGVITYDVFKD
jgi:hypothetical protein